jgi:predicted nucleic acid-binding protein
LRYWDASALLPLIVAERGSELVDGWLRSDDVICTWGLTRVELASAIERRAREGVLNRTQRREALKLVTDLTAAASEIVDLEAVRVRAVSVLARHALRAADAAQLGAALLVCEAGLPNLEFVCLDRRLADAAVREGLDVLSWSDAEDE